MRVLRLFLKRCLERGRHRAELASLAQQGFEFNDVNLTRPIASREATKLPWQKSDAEWNEAVRSRQQTSAPATTYRTSNRTERTAGERLENAAISGPRLPWSLRRLWYPLAGNDRAPSPALIVAAAMVTIILFGLTPITTRLLADALDGFSLGLLRVVAVGPVGAVLLLMRRRPPPRGRILLGLLAISTAGSFIGFPILFSLGTARTSATHAALCMATIPLITASIGLVLGRRPPGANWVLGTLIAIIGEIGLVLSRNANPVHGASLTGDLLVLASCVCVAAGFVAGGRLALATDTWTATFWSMTAASIGLAPLFATSLVSVPWNSFDLNDWLAVLHLTAGVAVGYMTWFFALGHGGVSRVAVLQFVQPVLSLIYAAELLGEAITLPTILAGSGILLGVAIARGRTAAAAQGVVAAR
jgi:drug/metabolite transporter (DMT)-like permease